MPSPPVSLRDLSEQGVLAELLAQIEHALREERVPERILRRGWVNTDVGVKVQDHRIVSVTIVSRVSYHRPVATKKAPPPTA